MAESPNWPDATVHPHSTVHPESTLGSDADRGPRSIVIAPGRVLPAYLRPTAANATREPTWSQHRGLILATLFLVTGALGLPLLWRSGRFGRFERWFWAAIVTTYTIGLIIGVVYLIRYTAGEMISPPGRN